MTRAAALAVLGLALLVALALFLRRAPGEGRPGKPPPVPAAAAPVPEPVVVAVVPAPPAPKPVEPPAPKPPPVPPTPPATDLPWMEHPQPGFVRGSVRIVGEIRPRRKLRNDSDPKCAALQPGALLSEEIVADESGRVQGAFVYVSDGLQGPVPPAPRTPVFLDQVGCRFTPHVLGVRVGQPLVTLNSDDLLHNVHSLPFDNKEFNVGLATAGQEHVTRFTRPEVMVKIKCDVHPWMTAWVGVLDHPYFTVTGEKGDYGIPKLPPGRYTIKIWHEKYADVTREVDVTANSDVVLDFVLDAKKP